MSSKSKRSTLHSLSTVFFLSRLGQPRLQVGVVLAALGVSACGIVSSNILDKTFALGDRKFGVDFGNTTGKVPSVACSSAGDPTCATLASQVTVSGGTTSGVCDTAARTCYANIAITKSTPITLSNEPSFAQTVGAKAITIVKAIEIQYTTNNASTVSLPDLNLYIGPETAKTAKDNGVVLIGKIPAIAANTQLKEPGKIVVPSGTPAFERFSYYLQNAKVPFNLLVEAAPTVRAGNDLPKGVLDVTVTPAFTVGIPL